MKTSKRTTAILLAALLILSTTVPALAASGGAAADAAAAEPSAAPGETTAAGDGEPSEKEEVIYVTLDASGELVSAYAVNSFPGGEITDYGDYDSVRVLNTGDEIEYKGGIVNITTDAKRIYYQGGLKKVELPWDISLTYRLDGKAVTAEEIAGKSGEAEIRFTVTQNEECAGTFYDDYALQASFTLPGDVFGDISAPDATVAAVGADRQLTYTLLPGEGIDTLITATAENFSLPAVSINGIHLNLNVDVNSDGIKDQVGQLVDAASQLNSGASALYSGSQELQTGASGLLDGSESLQSGIAELDAGVAELQDGLIVMRDGLNELYASSGDLTSGAGQVYSGLAQVEAALDALDVDTSQIELLVTSAQALADGAQSAYDGAVALQSALTADAFNAEIPVDRLTATNSAAIEQIQGILNDSTLSALIQWCDKTYGTDMFNQLAGIVTLLNSNSEALQGARTYVTAVGAEAGALVSGLGELSAGCSEFNSAVIELSSTVSGLLSQLAQLQTAIAQLTDGSAELAYGVDAYTAGVAQLVDGFGSVMSGVSALAEGSSELLSGSGELSAGAAELYSGVAELANGAQSMASGASALNSETSSLDVQAEIDSLLADIGGSMEAPVSFVDSRNGTIRAVQFVIQTEEISAPAEVAPPEPAAEEQSFWDKLLNLFGL